MNQIVDRRALEAAEDAVLDLQFDWIDIMKDDGVTRDELAERLGISKARVSQMFAVGANPTVKTVAKVYDALGRKVEMHSRRLSADKVAEPVERKSPQTVRVENATSSESSMLHTFNFFSAKWTETEPAAGPTNDNYAEPVRKAG